MKFETEFYIMKGYLLQEHYSLSSAMEDYLEMIANLSSNGIDVCVNELAGRLHVKVSSVTKMVQQLTIQNQSWSKLKKLSIS